MEGRGNGDVIQCYSPIAEHQDKGDDENEDDQIQYLSGGIKQKTHMQKNDHQTNKKIHIQHTTVTKPDLTNLSPRCEHTHTCMHLKNIQRDSILIDICSLEHEGICESSKVDFCLCVFRVVDGTEDSDGTENSHTFIFSSGHQHTVSGATNTTAATAGVLVSVCAYVCAGIGWMS